MEYGAACATGNVCPNSDDPLQCKGSGATAKCGCATGTFRHPTMKRCVAPAGAACTIRKDDGSAPITCTENANCWQTGTDLRCRCDAGAFYHQDSGECRMGHEGTTCNADVKCDFKQLLVCRDNKCVCPYENMFINPIEANARCRSLFGGKLLIHHEKYANNACLFFLLKVLFKQGFVLPARIIHIQQWSALSDS